MRLLYVWNIKTTWPCKFYNKNFKPSHNKTLNDKDWRGMWQFFKCFFIKLNLVLFYYKIAQLIGQVLVMYVERTKQISIKNFKKMIKENKKPIHNISSITDSYLAHLILLPVYFKRITESRTNNELKSLSYTSMTSNTTYESALVFKNKA